MSIGLQGLGENFDGLTGGFFAVSGRARGLGTLQVLGAKQQARATGFLGHLRGPHSDGVEVGGVGTGEDGAVAQFGWKRVEGASQGLRNQTGVSGEGENK